MVNLVNLTFDIADLIGADFDVRRTKVWIETNIASGSVIDTTGKVVRLGDVKATVATNGTGSFTGLFATNSADLNPTGFLYQAFVDYATRADGRKLWASGWFALTATSDLATVTPVANAPVNTTDDAVIASRVNDPASQTRAALSGVYVARTNAKAAATDDLFATRVTGDTFDKFVVNADGRLEWGKGNAATDLHMWRDDSFGFTQARLNKPLRFSGFWLVEGDPNATGEFNAGAGYGSNLAFLEVGITSVSIRRPASTGRLEFGQGDFVTLTSLFELDLSGAASAIIAKVRGATGQTGDLQRWEARDGLGSKVYVASDRALHVHDGTATQFRFVAAGGGLYLQHNADLLFTDIASGTARFAIDTTGKPKWSNAANAQTTVGAAGAASALPAAPTKYLRVVDSAGTTLVIPAYTAA